MNIGDIMAVKTILDQGGPGERILELQPIPFPAAAALKVAAVGGGSMPVDGTASLIDIWDEVGYERNYDADLLTGSLASVPGPAVVDQVVEVTISLAGTIPRNSDVRIELYVGGVASGLYREFVTSGVEDAFSQLSILSGEVPADAVLDLRITSSATGTLVLNQNSQFAIKRIF